MTSEAKRIFPIQQDPACLLKWAWSTVFFQSGTSSSCHRTRKHLIDPNDLETLHNHPEQILAREKMLEGQWPGGGCQYCRDVEKVGGQSDRMMQLQALTDPSFVPPELHQNNQSTSVTPTMLEIYFNNTCNMKCVYCGPHFSSLWEQENNKFNARDFETDLVKFSVRESQTNPNYHAMIESFWKYLEKDHRFRSLRRFHVLGGEPFLQQELAQCIDFWNDHPNPDLTFTIISNLNIPHKRFQHYMARFRDLVMSGKIMTIQIIGSMDAWGPQQEYTRFGIDLDLWQQNFESIVDQPWVTVGINSAISALTFKQMPLLLAKINDWNKIREHYAVDEFNRFIIHSFNYSMMEDNLFNFDFNVFEKDWKIILDLMPENHVTQINQKSAMRGNMQRHSSCANDVKKIEILKTYLSKLDQRRNTDWRKTFSWLDQDFSI